MKTLLTIAVVLLSLTVLAQSEKKSVVIGSMTAKPNALLILNPPNADQGIILPQLSTEQRLALVPSSPSEDGLMVFDTNINSYFYWNRGEWVSLQTHDSRIHSFYSIDPSNFQSLAPDENVRHSKAALFEADNSFVTVGRNLEGNEIIAPVNLPHGAVIKEFTVYYMDDDDNNIGVYFMRKPFSGNQEEIIQWKSSVNTNEVTSVSLNSFNGMESVDMERYTYRIVVKFYLDDSDEVDEPSDARLRVYGIKIKYQE